MIWEDVKPLSSELLVFRDHLLQLGDRICVVEDTVKRLEQQVTAFASDESLSSSSGSTSSTGGVNLRKRKRRNPLSLQVYSILLILCTNSQNFTIYESCIM